MTIGLTKHSLLRRGIDLAHAFCQENSLVMPRIVEVAAHDWRFKACAYYRPTTIRICVERCALIGQTGQAWSYPGYAVDRTPYGVIAHELGHHVDLSRGSIKHDYSSDYGVAVRVTSGEEPISGYCPDDAEWFAEVFRLFVTNPDLLRLIRPRAHARLIADGFRPVFQDSWEDRLTGAPERTITAATNRIAKAAKAAGRRNAA